MTTIIALFNLKPNVTAAEYEAWARATDLPTVRGLSSIRGCDVLRTGEVMGSDQSAPYQYIEIIQVSDMAAFGQDISTKIMQDVAAEFQSFADHPQFIMTSDISAE